MYYPCAYGACSIGLSSTRCSSYKQDNSRARTCYASKTDSARFTVEFRRSNFDANAWNVQFIYYVVSMYGVANGVECPINRVTDNHESF